MTIQVIGSGCQTCKKLFDMTSEVVSEMHTGDEVEYVTDISKIIEMGIMQSPVLSIDGKPVMVGFHNDKEKIRTLIKANTE